MRSQSRRDRRPTIECGGRGQSTALDYTLSLSVAALAVMGLITAAGGFVEDRREEVVRTELHVVGQQLATEITAGDRLVQSSSNPETVVVNRSLPSTVAGTTYTIEIETVGSEQEIVLSTTNPDVSVTVQVSSTTDLEDVAIQGGSISVVYDTGQLEVRS